MISDAETVVSIERQRLRSLVNRDMSVAERLHATDYELVTPNGGTLNKTGYLSDVSSKRLEYLVFEPETEISVLSSGSLVILRYIARIVLSVGVDDEQEFRAWHTDAYEQRDRRWVIVWSQATTITRWPHDRRLTGHAQ
jgi:Domain of unknown function (DUF4440)